MAKHVTQSFGRLTPWGSLCSELLLRRRTYSAVASSTPGGPTDRRHANFSGSIGDNTFLQTKWERPVPASTQLMQFLGSVQSHESQGLSASGHIQTSLKLVKAYMDRQDLGPAEALLISLQDASRLPAPVAPSLLRPWFQKLIIASAQAGESEAAIRIATGVLDKGMGLQEHVMRIVLESCVRLPEHQRIDRAAHVFHKLLSPGSWRKNIHTCLTLFDLLALNPALITKGMPGPVELWQALCENTPTTKVPPVWAHVARVKALLQISASSTGGNTELQQALCDLSQAMETHHSGMRRHQHVLSDLIVMIMQAGYTELALDLLKQVQPSLVYFRTMLQAGGGNQALLDHFWQLVQDVKQGEERSSWTVSWCAAVLSQSDREGHHTQQALQIVSKLTVENWREALIDDIAIVLTALAQRGCVVEMSQVRNAIADRAEYSPALARGLLACAAWEGKIGTTIALVQKLGADAQPADYECVLKSLRCVQIPAKMTRERRLCEDPSELLDWVLMAMQTGGQLSREGVSDSVAVLHRAAQMASEEQSAPKKVWAKQAIALVNKAVGSGERLSHGTAETLIRLCLLAGMTEHTGILLQQMEATQPTQDELARLQRVVIAGLAQVGKVWDAENWLVKMNTLTGWGPDETIMDAFLRGYARVGQLPTGLSMVQGVYNQYGVRPAKQAYSEALSRILERADIYEAKRALSIAEYLWGKAGLLQHWTEGVRGLDARLERKSST